jgi:hypothetical protein
MRAPRLSNERRGAFKLRNADFGLRIIRIKGIAPPIVAGLMRGEALRLLPHVKHQSAFRNPKSAFRNLVARLFLNTAQNARPRTDIKRGGCVAQSFSFGSFSTLY